MEGSGCSLPSYHIIIEICDKVLAYDEDTGEQAYKKVVRLFRNETKEWYHISVNGEEIVCTGGHPFYVASLDKFIPARELKLGDTLLLSDNTCVIIEEIQVERLAKPETTYNFEVEDYHTYYVNDSNVLVHNDCVKPNTARAEIEGEAHGSAKHQAEINKIAGEMADSGEYSKIYLNRSLHTTGVQNGSYLRPDIIGVKNGGGFKIVEVASKSQASGRALSSLMNNVHYYESIVGEANVSFIPWGY